MGLRQGASNPVGGDPYPFPGGYSWWVYPNVVKHEDSLLVSFCSNQGFTTIGSVNLITRQQAEFALQYCATGERSTAAICIMPDDHLLVVYPKHGVEWTTCVRRGKSPNSISFDEPVELASSGIVKYPQLVYVPYVRRYYLFYQVDLRQWALRWSDDGLSWSREVVFVTADDGPYYMRIAPCGDSQIKVVTAADPISSSDQALRLMVLDALDGCLRDKAGNVLARMDEVDTPLLSTAIPAICEAAPGYSLMLLDVCRNPRVGAAATTALYATWTSDRDCVYRVVRGAGDNWIESTVCSAGRPIGTRAIGDFGFGGAGFESQDDKSVYIAREDSGIWKIKKHTTIDYVSWDLAEVIAIDTVNRLYQPCVPIGANGDWLVWQRDKHMSSGKHELSVVGRAW